MTTLQTLGASVAMKIVDYSDVCDPATSSLYLTLYQVKYQPPGTCSRVSVVLVCIQNVCITVYSGAMWCSNKGLRVNKSLALIFFLYKSLCIKAMDTWIVNLVTLSLLQPHPSSCCYIVVSRIELCQSHVDLANNFLKGDLVQLQQTEKRSY